MVVFTAVFGRACALGACSGGILTISMVPATGDVLVRWAN